MEASNLHFIIDALLKSSLLLFALYAGIEVVVRSLDQARMRMWIRLISMAAAMLVLLGLLILPKLLSPAPNVSVMVGGQQFSQAFGAPRGDPAAVLNFAPIGAAVLTAGYLLGLGLVLGYTLIDWLRVRRQISNSEEISMDWLTEAMIESGNKVRFCLSKESNGSPFITSLIKPTIVLPVSLWEHSSPNVLRDVVHHELTHFRQGDLWWHGLAYFLFLPFYFHPAAWLMRARFVRDLEISCDEATAGSKFEDRLAYAKSLSNLAGMAIARPEVIGLGFPGMLQKRIFELLKDRSSDTSLGMRVRAFFLCGGVSVVVVSVGVMLFPLTLVGMPVQEEVRIKSDGNVQEWRVIEFDQAIRLRKGERTRDWLISLGVVMEPGSRAILKKGGKQLYARLSLSNWAKLKGE